PNPGPDATPSALDFKNRLSDNLAAAAAGSIFPPPREARAETPHPHPGLGPARPHACNRENSS
ncbi:MAG TPA: hypothetical protein PK807_14225, partial [Verrucomicrobiota bacterium]|nr:hypothetical protein [Verrucomicrobiota bacterium]